MRRLLERGIEVSAVILVHPVTNIAVGEEYEAGLSDVNTGVDRRVALHAHAAKIHLVRGFVRIIRVDDQNRLWRKAKVNLLGASAIAGVVANIYHCIIIDLC